MSLKNAPNSEHRAADKKTLTAIGNAILQLCATNGWSKNQLSQNLGIYAPNDIRICDYYQLRSGRRKLFVCRFPGRE